MKVPMSKGTAFTCNLCQQPALTTLIEFGEHPIAHHFLDAPTPDEYKHPVTLCMCENCGLVQLVDPVSPDLLYTNYNVLSSWKNQPHVPLLADLIDKLPGMQKTVKVLEVGSNDGIFLVELRKRGYQNLLGVEPAGDARRSAQSKGLEVIGTYFNPSSAADIAAKYGKFDLFIARQIIEHVSDLTAFREAMAMVLTPDAYVVIEVPNFAHNLRGPDYTIWEEHVNYFTLETLNEFLRRANVKLLHAEEILFSGEILTVLGQHVPTVEAPADAAESLRLQKAQAVAYGKNWPTFRDRLAGYLRQHRENGGRVAIYGAGCRSCSLINFAGLAPYIDLLVDDQREKQDRFMPGSQLPIRPGSVLDQDPVDLCLLAVNTENEDKVIANHAAFREHGGRFASILPPSNRLLEVWDRR